MSWKSFFAKRKLRSLLSKVTEKYDKLMMLNKETKVVIYVDEANYSRLLPEVGLLSKQVSSIFYVICGTNVKVNVNDHILVVDLQKDFSGNGLPKAEVLDKVQQIKADVLIDLTGYEEYAIKYVAALHDVSMKIGAKSEFPNLYNFSIVIPEEEADVLYLFKQISFYLNTMYPS